MMQLGQEKLALEFHVDELVAENAQLREGRGQMDDAGITDLQERLDFSERDCQEASRQLQDYTEAVYFGEDEVELTETKLGSGSYGGMVTSSSC